MAALLGLLSMAGGCAHLASAEDKRISYQRFSSMQVNGIVLGDYLKHRYAIIISGARPELIPRPPRSVDLRIQPVAKAGFNIGAATAIESDGYFLTAGHCVPRPPIYLLLPSESMPRILQARLVWSPPPHSPCDLAIVKVQQENQMRFEPADPGELHPGEDVVTVGYNDLAGGKLLKLDETMVPATDQTPAVEAIIHSAPLAEGDSGGPLATADGKLIGVEVLARAVVLGDLQGIALFPDEKWLQRIIQQDRAAFASSTRPATLP